jgi:hypothetical protein
MSLDNSVTWLATSWTTENKFSGESGTFALESSLSLVTGILFLYRITNHQKDFILIQYGTRTIVFLSK